MFSTRQPSQNKSEHDAEKWVANRQRKKEPKGSYSAWEEEAVHAEAAGRKPIILQSSCHPGETGRGGSLEESWEKLWGCVYIAFLPR